MADVAALSINNTSYNIKDVTARNAINNEISERQAQIAALQSSVGSPLIASTKAAMTNTSKIYVYTGSESGMTNGNWYYYNGSAWTSGGTYNSTAVETDKTLTVSNSPADAKVTGDKLAAALAAICDSDYSKYATITGVYVNASGVETTNANLACSDYIRIPEDVESITLYVLYNNSSGISPAGALYAEDKTFVTVLGSSGHTNGYKTFSIAGTRAKYLRFNRSVKAVDLPNLLCRFNYNNNHLGYLGRTLFNTTSANRFSIDYTKQLKANHVYRIVATDPSYKKRFRFMLDSSTTGAVDMSPFDGEAIFIPSNDGCLRGYNVNNDATCTMGVDVYDLTDQIVKNNKRVYHVSKDSSLGVVNAYTSFTQCLLDLKDDESEKTIVIDSGEYDIYQEYVEAGVPVYTGSDPTSEYHNYCVWIPKNTHVIGRGVVKLSWMPDVANVTANQCIAVSPLNVADTCTLENLEVYCKNGRYCLHNDGPRSTECIGAIQHYKNIKFYKYAPDTVNGETYGKLQTIGFGIDAEMRYEFETCEFYNYASSNAFYGHTRGGSGTVAVTESNSGNIVVRDCVIVSDTTNSVRLDNYDENTELHVRVTFANCYIANSMIIPNANYPNAYDITMLNCNTVPITKPNSRYPVKIYPPVT